MTATLKDALTPPQVAEMIGCSTRTIYLGLRRQTIPGFKMFGRWYVRRQWVEDVLSQVTQSLHSANPAAGMSMAASPPSQGGPTSAPPRL